MTLDKSISRVRKPRIGIVSISCKLVGEVRSATTLDRTASSTEVRLVLCRGGLGSSCTAGRLALFSRWEEDCFRVYFHHYSHARSPHRQSYQGHRCYHRVDIHLGIAFCLERPFVSMRQSPSFLALEGENCR